MHLGIWSYLTIEMSVWFLWKYRKSFFSSILYLKLKMMITGSFPITLGNPQTPTRLRERDAKNAKLMHVLIVMKKKNRNKCP